MTKKKSFWGLPALALAVGLVLAGCGGGNPSTDFERRTNHYGGVTITGYNGQSKVVKIPAKLDGKPVTVIGTGSFGEGAFARKGLTSVTIPKSVTVIEGEAFANNQLTSVTIPNSVTDIWYFAFANNRLTSVTIPNSVTEIGNDAFGGNPLTSVTIGKSVMLSSGSLYEGDSAFTSGFNAVYNANGKQAGTYTRTGNTWAKR